MSNTDKAESLYTKVTNADQSSNGHPHTLLSQDISKINIPALSKEKEKEKQQLN